MTAPNLDGILPTKEKDNNDSLIEYALSSDDYLEQFVPIIKAELVNKNSLDGLISRLDNIYKNKEQDLAGVSFNSVDNLTNSIENISAVTKVSGGISRELVEINTELRKTGLDLSERKKMSLTYKRLYNKITETILSINSCLDILDKTNKVFDLIQTNEFYKALMNLESLTKSRSEEIENFDFTKKIYRSLPAVKQIIIDETFNQLVKWFNISYEKNLTSVGELLFENFERLNLAWFDAQSNNDSLLSFKINTPLEQTLREDEFKSFNPLDNDQLNVDLSPIYHSMMVFQSINEFDRLRDDFANELLRKRDRLIYPIREALASNSLDMFSNNESLKIMIFSLTALFVSDRLITAKTEYLLRTKKQTDDMYESVISKFIPILKRHIERFRDNINRLKELNDIMGLFIQILENYEFNVSSLYQLMIQLLKDFIDCSIKEFRTSYMSLSMEENPQPITIETQTQLSNIQANCFHRFKEIEMDFPIVLPFSIIYAATCFKLRGFIHDIYEFLSKYYNHKTSSILKLIGNSIDEVLINIILKDLDNKIHSSYKEEVSQNLINLEFFSTSVVEIEKYLNYSFDPMIVRFRSSPTLIKLEAESEFKSIRTKAEEGMFDLVDSKIDMLFDMVEFDWESKTLNEEPSIGIKDMGLFLENIFMLDFSHLPYSIKSLLLIRTFDKIVTFMKQSIFQTDFITNESIVNFELDIQYIESIVPNLRQQQQQNGDVRELTSESESSNLTLQTIFVGLKQIIELLKDGNLEVYKDDTARMRKFNTIKPEEAIELVQKLEDYQLLKREMSEHESAGSQLGYSQPQDDLGDARSVFGFKRATTANSLQSPSKYSSMLSFNKK